MSGSFLGHGKSRDRWSAQFQDELEKLELLPPGSDSWSPHRPKPEVFDIARQIGEDAGRCGRFVSIVTATSEGGIQLKWQDPQRELSLLVYPDQTVEYLFVQRDRDERRSGTLSDIRRVGDFVSALLS